MTLSELKQSKRVSLLHTAGYAKNVSCNTPVPMHSYKVTYQKKNGEVITIGVGSDRSIDHAREKAFNSALVWANE